MILLESLNTSLDFFRIFTDNTHNLFVYNMNLSTNIMELYWDLLKFNDSS